MRNKLLLSAAIAVAFGAPAFADTDPIVKPAPPVFEIDVDAPEAPTHASPLPAEFVKTEPSINDLFEPEGNRFRQQARILQDGDGNVADTDQTGGQEGLTHIRQEGDGNNADVSQSDAGDNAPLPNPPTDFVTPTNVAIIGQTGAENATEINQANASTNGPRNLADVHQFAADDASALSNEALINQLDGRALTARINQGGEDARANNNSAMINQTGQGNTTVSVGAFVDQQSDGSSALVNQADVDEATVTIVQEGFAGAAVGGSNTAEVTQTGGEYDLNVELFQGNAGTGGGANDAVILQAGRSNTVVSSQIDDDNLLDIDQSGEYNKIHTEQNDQTGFTSNSIEAVQSGDDNALYVRQLDAPNETIVDQDGSRNVTNVEQIGSGANAFAGFTNTLNITQTSSDNLINVLQQNDNNDATIDQDGTFNTVNLEQSDGFDNGSNAATLTQSAAVSDSTINLVQDDSENTATLTQTAGSNLSLDVQQSGNDITNFGFGDRNEATVNQAGVDNMIDISQTADNEPGFNLTPVNAVFFDQDGVNNLAQIVQIGEGNTVGAGGAPVTQTGSDHILQISQSGRDNSVVGAQSGTNNALLIVSAGEGNLVDFMQSSYDNTASVSQNGDDNTATLLQTTALNTALFDQTGDSNTATINQTVQNTQHAVAIQNGVGNSITINQ